MIYKMFFSLLIAAVIINIGPISGLSQRSAFAGGTTPAVASSTNSFEGLIVVKEADGIFLVRSETGDTKRLKIDKSTTVTRNGKPAAYTDLRSRDRIRVQYNSNFVATEIEAGGP